MRFVAVNCAAIHFHASEILPCLLSHYSEQLEWYDSILRGDGYMMGATIFLIDGTSDWDAFSINGEVAELLTQYLKTQKG